MNAVTEPVGDAPNGKRRVILTIIALVFITLGVLWGLYWFLVLSKRERTDDAYVNGNKVVISAQVSGTVIAVLTDDTQLVKAGQVLVRLDPIDAQTALARAASALGQQVRQVREQKLTADQYDSLIATRRLELTRAKPTSPNANRWWRRAPLRWKKCGMRVRASSWPRRRWCRPSAKQRLPMPWWMASACRKIRRCCRRRPRTATRGLPRSVTPWSLR
jgi:multidrug resistance efflux pump